MMNAKQQAFLNELLALKATMVKVRDSGNDLTMGTWGQIKDDEPSLEHPCGTAACIIGWHVTPEYIEQVSARDCDARRHSLLDRLAGEYAADLGKQFSEAVGLDEPIHEGAYAVWESHYEDRVDYAMHMAKIYGRKAMKPIIEHPFNQSDANETPSQAVDYLQTVHDTFKAIWSK